MKNGETWIELQWDKPAAMNHIQLSFDTGLNRFLRISPEDSVYKNQVRGPQTETISDYTIEIKSKGKAAKTIKIQNNFLRLARHDFEATEADSIRITIQKTHGDPLAKIFEVRCYLD